MDRLDEAVAIANIPTLIPVIVQLTGDERWLEVPYRPTRARGLNDHDDGGLPPAVQEEVRDAAREAIAAWLDGAPVAIPDPSEALLLRMLSVSMAEPIPAEYGPMLRHVLGFVPEREASRPITAPPAPPPGYRAVVIGAGASGMAMAVELQRAGIDYTIIEKADAVGGTWWHNRYPGCGVDTPSHLYCFSFYDDYDWPAYFSLRDTLHVGRLHRGALHHARRLRGPTDGADDPQHRARARHRARHGADHRRLAARRNGLAVTHR